MNLAMNQEQENRDTQNIVPLGSEEIRSILKSQSESVFEDKNITNNSNFVKKSLIDIALDFESKQNIKENLDNEVKNDAPENNKNLNDVNDVPSDVQKTEESMLVENKESENKIDTQAKTDQSSN